MTLEADLSLELPPELPPDARAATWETPRARGLLVPIPSYISLAWAFGVSLAIFIVEVALGSNPVYSGKMGMATLLIVAAFNALGGATSLNGLSICWLLASELLVPRLAKISLGEAVDSRLLEPELLSTIYLVGTACIFFAAVASARVASWFQIARRLPSPSVAGLRRIGLAGLALSISFFVLRLLAGESRILLGVLSYVTEFRYVGLIAYFAYVIGRSNGRKALDPIAALYVLLLSAEGFQGLWKEAILRPYVLWLLSCVLFGLRFRIRHVVALGAALTVIVGIVLPIASLGHEFTGKMYPSDGGLDLAKHLALDVATAGGVSNYIDGVKQLKNVVDVEESSRYYGGAKGFLDRLTLTEAADKLLYHLNYFRPIGWSPFFSAISLIPHSLTGTEPFILDNYIPRVTGLLQPNDYFTGISYGPIMTAYSVDRWVSLVSLCFLLPLLFFVVNRIVFPAVTVSFVAAGYLYSASRVWSGISIDGLFFYAVRSMPIYLLLMFLALRFLARDSAQRRP